MGFQTFTLDDYYITRTGEIYNKKWGYRKLKPQPNGKGYLRVHIAGKMYFVHRLVAEMYVPNPENKPQVNHKDGNKLNNNADNLEWVTNQENRNHAIDHGMHHCGEDCSWSKLTKQQVDFMRKHTEIDSKELAITFNISRSYVYQIRRNDSWKH